MVIVERAADDVAEETSGIAVCEKFASHLPAVSSAQSRILDAAHQT